MTSRETLAQEVQRVLREFGSKSKPLSMGQAAERTGVSAASIHAMVNAKGKVTPVTLYKFAFGFGLDVEQWLALGNYTRDDVPSWMLDSRQVSPLLLRLEAELPRLPKDAQESILKAALWACQGAA